MSIDPGLRMLVRQAAERASERGFSQESTKLVERLARAAAAPNLEERIDAARSNRWAGAVPSCEPVVLHVMSEEEPVPVVGIDGSQIYPQAPVLWTYIQAIAYKIGQKPFTRTQFIDIGSQIFNGGEYAPAIFENIDNLNPLVDSWRALIEMRIAKDASSLYPGCLTLMDGGLLPWLSVGSAAARLYLHEYLADLVSIRPGLIASIVSGPQSRLLSNLINLAEAQTIEEGLRTKEYIPDTRIMYELLRVGERSALFTHGSPRNDAFRGEGAEIYFFFLRINHHELVRVEIPEWVAKKPCAVAVIQSSILKDSKATGYSYCLTQAHKQVAVPREIGGEMQDLAEQVLLQSTGKPVVPPAKVAMKTA